MLRVCLGLLALALGPCVASPAAAFTYWNEIRNSDVLPGGDIVIRTENPRGGGADNTVLFRAGGVQERTMIAVEDGPNTIEAAVPGPIDEPAYYGFRLVQGVDIDLLAVRVTDGISPGRDDLSRVAADPVGDEIYGRTHLDLTDCRVGSDGVRLYAALTNAGDGFPVSAGLTFFSYLLGIKDPAVSDPDIVFAMIHTVAVAGIIEPGLYRIFGTGVSDLEKIGEITADEIPGENTLVLSCLLSDLEADPVFQAWYDAAEPRLDVAGFSQRITLLGGVGEADSTPGGVWHLRTVAVDPGLGQTPELSALVLNGSAAGGFASVVYADADGHCPVQAEVVFDGGAPYALRPQTLDYGGPVVYRSDDALPPLQAGNWAQAVVRFSDNGVDVVELSQDATSAVRIENDLLLRAAPNPSSGRTEFAFELPRAQSAELIIYNLAGRRVATLASGQLAAGIHARSWDGRDAAGRPQPAGIYFYRVRGPGLDVVRRLTLVR